MVYDDGDERKPEEPAKPITLDDLHDEIRAVRRLIVWVIILLLFVLISQ